MLPSHLYEEIGKHLAAADCARLASTCKSAHQASLRPAHVCAIVPASRAHLKSFALWLMRRVRHIETLILVTDVKEWSYVWRFAGVRIAPLLRHAEIIHTASSFLNVPSSEEILPVCPLESLKIQAKSLQLGGGFSRLKLKKLGIFGECLGIEQLTLTIPTLERLTMRGLVCDTCMASAGLVFSKMRHLECPAYMMPVVSHLSLLECLIVDAEGCVVALPETFSLSHLRSLRSVRLRGGHWTGALDWLPPGLAALECISCMLHSFPAFLDLEFLMLVSCILSEHAAASLAGPSVSHVMFYTLGIPTPPLPLRCITADSPAQDLPLLTLLGSRARDSTGETAIV